jgi:hypothetical protein
LAINRQRSQFVILTELEAKACSGPLRPYCTFQSPAYSINTGMCVVQIFMEKREGISRFCKEIIIPRPPFPQARYLTDGHWLVTADTPLTFSVLRNSTKSKEMTAKVPIDIIRLDMTCSAYNPRLTLLPYYNKESRYNMTTAFTLFLKQYKGDGMTLWETFERAVPNTTIIIPPKLKEMKAIPIDTLIDELNKYKLTLKPMPNSPRYWICVLGLLAIILILALLIRFRHKLPNCSKNKSKKRSVERGKKDVSGSPMPSWSPLSVPRHAGTRPGTPSNEGQPIVIDNQCVTYRPNLQLASEYMREKYGTSPPLDFLDSSLVHDIEPTINRSTHQSLTNSPACYGPENICCANTTDTKVKRQSGDAECFQAR